MTGEVDPDGGGSGADGRSEGAEPGCPVDPLPSPAASRAAAAKGSTAGATNGSAPEEPAACSPGSSAAAAPLRALRLRYSCQRTPSSISTASNGAARTVTSPSHAPARANRPPSMR